MLFVFAYIIFSVIFGQLFKVASVRKCNPVAVSTVNYLVAGIILTGAYLVRVAPVPVAPLFAIGVFGGVAFIASLLALIHALGATNVGATMTAFRLSLVVPILVAIVLWDEHPSIRQSAGVLLVCLSLTLMTRNASPSSRNRTSSILPIIAVFVCEGLAKTALRMVPEFGLNPYLKEVLAVIFLTAFVIGAVTLNLQHLQPSRLDVLLGTAIGVINIVATGAILKALTILPGYVVFSVGHTICVLLDNACAWAIWKEPITRTKLAGVALGVLAAALISLN